MDLLKRFWQEEDGLGVVEIILIIVVLIALVVLFRDNIERLINKLFDNINKDVDSI
ncbi:MAG: Flp1 family type IVb pilin [Eubacteriales bacterium]